MAVSRWLWFAAALVLSGLAFAWSERELPFNKTVRVDVLREASDFIGMRTRIFRRQAAMPRLREETAGLAREVRRLGEELARRVSNELYVVVNPSANRLHLRRGRAEVLEAKISTGRDDTLVSGGRRWVFETPRGIMTVMRKKKDPVWIKPDWAFVEKGESIPPWDSPLRREKGILGDYMLDLGGGVMIHGTPQEHLLGRSVTHGCVRVGGKDLKVLFDSVDVGTRVFIY